MKKLLGLVMVLVPICTVHAAERVGDFALLDHNGQHHQIGRYNNQQAVVLLAEGANCNSFGAEAAQFNTISKKYSDAFEFMFINATGVQERSPAQAQAEAFAGDLPLLMDESQLVSELLGVSTIGEAIIVDPKQFEILYRGSVAGLESALADIAVGRQVTLAPEPNGCTVKFAAKEVHDRNGVSYSQDIAPLLEEKCANCHREQGIAPFAMDSHLMIQGWAPMIKEVVMTKRMPPGQIDPHIGKVKVARNLTSAEIQDLVHWIDAGALKDPNEIDPLTLIEWPTTKWPLGEPDVVVKIPVQEVPATGVMDYIWVDSGYVFDKDRWIKGADLIPGDRSVVHHILANAVPPGAEGPKIGICPSPCETGQGNRDTRPEDRGIGLPAYIPGNNARFLEENTGQFVPAGSRMVFQMHYTTNGRASTDASEFGLYFYEDGFVPTEEIASGGVLANDFLIPPGDGDYEVVRKNVLARDAHILSFYPHMHLRGKRMKWTAVYPDGSQEDLLSVPNYDFNWQMTYELVEPKFVPAGTTILVEGAFDNSATNKNNPDPTASVTWGDQSFEEMFIGSMAMKHVDDSASP
ncbi:MAG: hypothetical protein WDZ76_06560 [Pseudohongiellaceae bacterium]